MVKKVYFIFVTLLLGALLIDTGGCVSVPSTPPGYSYPPGGVTGPSGMMGPGGMMGRGGITYGSGQRITMQKATEIVQTYLSNSNNPDIKASEIMEFQYNFYVQLVEKSTGLGAFEVLIDPFTGDMYPEPGPNMMWNTKYGAMSGMMWGVNAAGPMTVTADQAKQYALNFLSGYLSGSETETPNRFYGYYTLDILKDGKIYGMLSVNGYTGQVWFHSWHGQFISEEEL